MFETWVYHGIGNILTPAWKDLIFCSKGSNSKFRNFFHKNPTFQSSSLDKKLAELHISLTSRKKLTCYFRLSLKVGRNQRRWCVLVIFACNSTRHPLGKSPVAKISFRASTGGIIWIEPKKARPGTSTWSNVCWYIRVKRASSDES